MTRQAMDYPLIQVSRKTKAVLINHVLRVYTLVTANEPVCATKKYDYLYDYDAARFTLLEKHLVKTLNLLEIQKAVSCLS